MAVLCILLLTRFLLQAAANSTAALISPPECCLSMLDANGTCPITSQCSPGCYRHWTEDGASTCLKCRKETNLEFEAFHNLTSCRNISFHEEDLKMNASTAHPFVRSMGEPEIAASLLLGTFFLSLLLIFSVAFFFYLKRSNVLPDLFYRRNKASILQPSETASMIPTPASSVRKPRYVRRERSSVTSASAIVNSDAETRVSNV
ncbi:uncharacterized protein C1orf159-like isoform X1 [Rhinatrema bivittatum]|uniref:uncharacterized protein C1orf159 homolog isoform X1 n=1 Tax=Rhinatrema bivittatum TaxID=194408 RepID=UPI001126FE74|nr:uncharacterized protein C1orf159 homolog isoform X1 [Rhinatrema bivittatum]XP_029433956.1 uncharacterized protein C1orf159 homolog isoform X1 [Rhinatrema bivittatum]XP_029433957.1 uncharacterized protein C1orf159 homolog isoform X1 [Rhinatrema bivittatum]XP_029434027.1 uncharacterized protein C1orf159-like isoform X1 [Rhinatrema bivittatum]XP_029434028.1 uncharacterized protein C1orf159-like isoform X1 [Rhinatrema bivittatum]